MTEFWKNMKNGNDVKEGLKNMMLMLESLNADLKKLWKRLTK
jgi:hypothetical protein